MMTTFFYSSPLAKCPAKHFIRRDLSSCLSRVRVGSVVRQIPRARGWQARLLAAGIMLALGLQAVAYDAGEAQILNMVWRVRNGTDSASTINATERDSMPSDGAIFYIPRYGYSGTIPLYRLLKPGGSDHMDSKYTSEAGYVQKDTLGRAYQSQSLLPGLSPIIRGYNLNTADFATRHSAEPSNGYDSYVTNIAYGWRRYNNTAEDMLTLSAGGVTVQANRVAGGALWRWTWNGKQFVNNGYDYGRQLQVTVSWPQNGSSGGGPNPTEAGSKFSRSTISPAARQGSPCYLATTTPGTSPMLSTRAVPLEWNTDSLSGKSGSYTINPGGPNNPNIWKDIRIGKDLTLNFNGLGAVAKFKTVLTLPASLDYTKFEMPTAYLTADLRYFYSYDAGLAARNAISPNEAFVPASAHGGIIAANLSGTYAMGIYGVLASHGGSITDFEAMSWVGTWNDGTSETSGDTTKITANRRGTLDGGTTAYTAWIITGTLSDVQDKMNALYAGSYQQWSLNAIPAALGPDARSWEADPDNDGMINLLEYAFGTNPTQPEASPVSTFQQNGTLAVAFPCVPDAFVTYAVEGSDDLVTWECLWSNEGGNQEGFFTVADLHPIAEGQSRFLRVRVDPMF